MRVPHEVHDLVLCLGLGFLSQILIQIDRVLDREFLIFEPWMFEGLLGRWSFARVLAEHLLNQIFRLLRRLSHVVIYVANITFHVFAHNSLVVLGMKEIFHGQ